jgi:hypothetical protein
MYAAVDSSFHCATCEADIPGIPVIHVGIAFCCHGCVAGGPCICSYDPEVQFHDQSRPRGTLEHVALADDRGGLAREPVTYALVCPGDGDPGSKRSSSPSGEVGRSPVYAALHDARRR